MPRECYRSLALVRAAALFALLLFLSATVPVQGQEHPIPVEGFVVTGARIPRLMAELTSHVTVLSGESLRERGVTYVSDALQEIPGLVAQKSGSFGSTASVFFRGGESDYVLVLLDGVQMNQPGGAFDFSSLTTDNIERIEIVRGPASALYGSDAASGVIQIITRGGRGAPSGSVTARAGSYGTREWVGELSGGNETARYGFSLSHRSTDGILDFNNRFQNSVFSGSVRLSPGDATWARISTRYTDREFHYPTDETGAVVDRNAFTYGDELALSLDAGHRLSDRFELRALLTLSELDTGTDDAPDGPADTLGFFGYTSLSDVRRAAADLHVNVHLMPRTVLTVGGEFEEESERSSNQSLTQFGPSGGWTEHSRRNVGLFSQIVTDARGLSVNIAGRVEENERFGNFTTYQAGASYRIRPAGLKVRASVGRAVKEPTFLENFATGFAVGNPNLDPERSAAWEVGVDQDLWDGSVQWTATYFSQRFSDLIQYTSTPPEPGGPTFYNVAEARADGLELSVVGSTGPVSGTAGYTYLDTEVLDSGFQEGSGASFVAGERLLRRPTHLYFLNTTYSIPGRGSLNAGLRYVGSRDDRDFSGWPAIPVELPGYAIVDLGASLTLFEPLGSRPGVTLLLRAENLLDKKYEEVFAYPAPGRGLYVGARVSFGG